jgi:phage-related protein
VGEVIAAALGRAHGALDALGYAFGFVLGFVLTLAVNVFARIGASIVGALTSLVNLVRGLLEVLVGLFTGNFERARAGVGQIMQGLVQVITAPLALLGQQAVEWGRNIMGGLAQGLSAGLSGVAERIAQGGEAIKNWFRSLFQIRSPSRVFAGYGLMLSLGLAQGIEAGMPQVADAVAGMEQSLQPRVELAQPGLTPPPAQARPRAERSIAVSINIEQIQIGSGQPRQVVQELQPAIKEAVLLALEELALEEGVDG